MHISFVSDTFSPDINGVAVCLEELINQLRSENQQVSLVRPAPRTEYEPQAFEVYCRGVRLPHYPEVRVGLPSHRLFYRLWKTHRPDIIYLGTEGPLGLAALITARRLKIPVISAYHTNFHEFSKHYGLSHLQGLAFSWLRIFHNHCQLNLIPSRALQQELTQLGFKRPYFLSHAVDTQRFHPRHRSADFRRLHGLNDNDILLLFVGRIAKEKNIEVALNAYQDLKIDHANLKMMVTGSGPELARLKASYPDVIFTGALTGQDLSVCYASSDTFVMPSKSETFGLVSLEALASGLPVIAYDLAAAAEHITCGVNGELCEELSDRAFYRALECFLLSRSDQHIRSICSINAVASVQEASWGQVTQDFIKLCRGIIGAERAKLGRDQALEQKPA